jgi:hypothetical protein
LEVGRAYDFHRLDGERFSRWVAGLAPGQGLHQADDGLICPSRISQTGEDAGKQEWFTMSICTRRALMFASIWWFWLQFRRQ